MSRKKLILYLSLFVIVYYFILFKTFEDKNRWAREYLYYQKLLQQMNGQFTFNTREPNFWDKALNFLNDHRKKPESARNKGSKSPWWMPKYSKKEKQNVSRFLKKFQGKSEWLNQLDPEHLQDSILSFYEKSNQKYQKEFKKWMGGYTQGSSAISDEKAFFFLLAGNQAYRYQQFDLGVEILQKGLQLAQDQELIAKLYQTLGYIEHERLNLNQSEQYFKKSIQIKPREGSYYINLGWNYFLKKDFKNCIKYNKKAIEHKETDWIPYYNIAISNLALEKYKQAYSSYKRLKQDDLDEKAYYYLLEDLFILKEMKPNDAAINFFIGYAYLNHKMFTKSKEYFNIYFENPSPMGDREIYDSAKFFLKKLGK